VKDCFGWESTALAMTKKQGEITMNTENENQEFTDNSAYDPFPQPQTIPSGWDMSEILFPPTPARNERSEDLVENEHN
jgi:hypothetical protein